MRREKRGAGGVEREVTNVRRNIAIQPEIQIPNPNAESMTKFPMTE